MNTRFRLPTLLIVIPSVLLPIWYYLNTDEVASWLFGEPLHYCNIISCAVTRQRFFPVATLLCIAIIIGIILLLVKLNQGAKNAKD